MDIVLRATVAFFFLFLLTRITGRRNLSALEPFDLILIIMLGDLVQQGVTQSDYSVTGLVLAAGSIAILSFLTAWASYRFRRLRPVLDGEPVVVIEDGKIIEQNLARQRITKDELAAQARLQKIASFDQVAWGIIEKGGQFSFIPKESGGGN
jgi:uncharacterized membrane protein YcaP (DUF421 family)